MWIGLRYILKFNDATSEFKKDVLFWSSIVIAIISGYFMLIKAKKKLTLHIIGFLLGGWLGLMLYFFVYLNFVTTLS